MDQLIEKLAQVPPSQRYLLLVLIVGGLAAGYYYFVYDSQQMQLASYRADYERKMKDFRDKEKIAKERPDYERELGQYQKDLDEMRAKLPDNADVPQLLAQLGSRARQTGLAISEFKPMAEASKGFYAEIPFGMTVKGSYHEIALFIDSIGKLDRIINVTSLAMGNAEEANAKVTVTASFDIKTYRFTKTKKDGS